ncbi:MAG: hypothetical protein ACTSUF_00665 [Candidatus Heimdallarchaeaceae archaeon]
MSENPIPEDKTLKKNNSLSDVDTAKKYVPFGVILGRDLIFMDWTVQFGGQILGIILGALLAGIFGVNLFKLFTPSEDNTVPADSYLFLEIGTALCVIALSLYYINKLGIQLNRPRSIASNKLNILKVVLFAFSFIFGLAYLYNSHLAPCLNKISGVQPPNNGTSGDSEGAYVDFKTTNQLVSLFLMLAILIGVYALLYAGLIYSLNKKVNTMDGVAIITPAILLTFNMLSQYSIRENLLKGQIVLFLGEFAYFFAISVISIIAYHLSRRIELSIITLFIGYSFGYRSPSNIFTIIITLKWGFPNLSDGINSTSDVLAKGLESIEYAALAGMVVLPLIFYRDTISFFKKTWETIRYQGLRIIFFLAAVLAIEVTITFLYQYLSFIFAFFAFIILVGVVNSFITSQYGSQSYAALLTTITQATIQLNSPFIPSFDTQTQYLERHQKKRQKMAIILGTIIPVILYFLIMYITTAITSDLSVGEIMFFVLVIPLTIGIVAFAITYFFVKDPLIKDYFTYSIKTIALIGGVIYYLSIIHNLEYGEIGTYPLLALLYLPMIYIPIKAKKSFADLLFYLAGENQNKALKELSLREDIDYKVVSDNLYAAPSFLKIWLALLLTKRLGADAEDSLSPMIISEFPAQRITATICLLYLQKSDYYERFIKILEDDDNPDVRKAVAYGFRYATNLSSELYGRLIDAQHYEENPDVLAALKDTVAHLDEYFAKNEEKREELEEIYY